MTTIAVSGFFLLALLGMPLAFALGFSALAGMTAGDVEWAVFPQRMMYALNSFPLLAIPCFMVAGELMVEGGIMERLILLANSVVGRVRGGLAHVTVLSSASLAAVSGTAIADATALSSTMMPTMEKYYDRDFGAALIASAANLGPIIPPSAAMIVYAYMAGPSVSVGALFMAGVVPGLILAASMMLYASWYARRRNYPPTGEAFNLRRFLVTLKSSLVVVAMPFVVIGGIVGGAFTATEGSAIAVVYALVVGMFITRRVKLADLPQVLFRAAVTTGVVGALIAFASAVTYLLTVDMVPMHLASFVRELTSSPLMFILLVMVLLVIVGMFLESNAAYIMLVPLLAPIATAYGIDPIYFGFLFVLNLVIGMLTPPVGVLLFVVSSAARVPINRLTVAALPFIALQFAVLALCIAFPPLVTALPRALGY
jgi:tripartite ATP-independent transporter DctM subunit